MKRDLIKQMGNEWRENIWLVLELFIVLVAVWVLSTIIYSSIASYTEPTGFRADNVYYMEIKSVNNESPQYIDFGEEAKVKAGEDKLALIGRIRKSPYVEAAAFSANGRPYSYSYQGNQIGLNDGDSIGLGVNIRNVSPDMALILNYESLDGLTPRELRSFLQKGEVLIGSYPEYDEQRDPRNLLGKPLYIGTDSTRQYISHSLIRSLKRNEFESMSWNGALIIPINEEAVAAGNSSGEAEIVVRLKPGTEQAFLEEFRNTPEMQKRRNTYLSQPQSLVKTRERVIRTKLMQLRLTIGGAICLLAIVFLGLLGTFWYRIRRRESEIAIRKVNGATSGDIFRRLISEGMLLTLFATVFALLLAALWIFKGKGPETDDFYQAMAIGGVFALVSLLLVVVTGISIPARIAMKIEPAVALKDE